MTRRRATILLHWTTLVLLVLLLAAGVAQPMLAWGFALLGASALHGIFHLWRHTALGDGALRRMTPGALHGVL